MSDLAEEIVDIARAPSTSRADAKALFSKALDVARQQGVVEGIQRGYDKAAAVLENAARDARL